MKPTRRDVLIGALGLTAGVIAGEGCWPDKEQPPEKKKEVLASDHQGDWMLEATAIGTVTIREQKKTVFHFLKRVLQEQPWFVSFPQKDQQDVLDGYIELIKDLNPGVDIENFTEVDGKPIRFPTEVDVLSRPAGEVSKGKGGYSRVQELARADGFDISDKSSWETMYDRALAQTVEVPPNSPYYHLDREGSEDSPARLEPDALKRLEEMGRDFAARTFGGRAGWKLSLTDFLRSPAVQKARHAGEKNPVLATTHYTGRTFDVPDGRFIDPDGKEITWSEFFADGRDPVRGPHATMIEQEIRPAILEVMTAHGFYPYREGAHWHAYAPREHHVDLHSLEIK